MCRWWGAGVLGEQAVVFKLGCELVLMLSVVVLARFAGCDVG
jgi:hypothetical protein